MDLVKYHSSAHTNLNTHPQCKTVITQHQSSGLVISETHEPCPSYYNNSDNNMECYIWEAI